MKIIAEAERNTKIDFFDRDISWLSFNERVLEEAQRDGVPLMERIKFMSIYSSNLDEFYRVRIPALMALQKLEASEDDHENHSTTLSNVTRIIQDQQKKFGKILLEKILPSLREKNIRLLYNEPLLETIIPQLRTYFLNRVATYLHVAELLKSPDFFPENNKLYFIVTTTDNENIEKHYVVNIPSDHIPRFYQISSGGTTFVVFIDDIIRNNVHRLFRNQKVTACHSFKVTRDAELDLKDEFEGDLAKKIEQKILQRDQGLATRFLYEPAIAKRTLRLLQYQWNMKKANFVEGGPYHNLKDLVSLPLNDPAFFYPSWPQIPYKIRNEENSLFQAIEEKDILLHTPYHSYEPVLRFFNEASIDPDVTQIYITLYRVARESRIVHALMNAAKNGKHVTVFVELKARFDEANNIRWSKQMQACGVNIINSLPGVKVHAKIAIIKRKNNEEAEYLGLFSTGNFNESTAQHYTDHVLFTADQSVLKEAKKVFSFLKLRLASKRSGNFEFDQLLVGKFNLQQRFLELIEREIAHARQGAPASIIIKMNNLEDRTLITKLYEASQAGVKILLIIRSICCLKPGIEGMSENIVVKRIIDRYLEHGRIFLFHNNGEDEIFLGSADWMNRNIYRRIEVCFPLKDQRLKSEIRWMLDLQLRDNVQATILSPDLENIFVYSDDAPLQSQKILGTNLLKTRLE